MLEHFVNFVSNNSTMRLKNETTEEYLDIETGEIRTQTTSKTFSIKLTQEHFYLTYFDNLASFYKLTSIKEIFLLSELCRLAEYNTGNVVLANYLRVSIMEKCNIERTYFSTCLKNLCEKGLIKKLSSNYYKVNPSIFWKGDEKSRQSLLQNGGKININIEFEKE